jgi:methylated-DNA-[protein]-cysteine S-methyltransferase
MSTQLNWQAAIKPSSQHTYFYMLPIGQLQITMQANCLLNMTWITTNSVTHDGFHYLPLQGISLYPPYATANYFAPIQILLKHLWQQPSTTIDIPLLLQGTAFQRQVWQALSDIPSGQTRTYGELANSLNTSPRALANACRQNPFPFIIPCHRVLAKTSMGGYAGQTTGPLIAIKSALLQHEQDLTHEF